MLNCVTYFHVRVWFFFLAMSVVFLVAALLAAASVSATATYCDSAPCRSGGTCNVVAARYGPPVAVPSFVIGSAVSNTGNTAITGSVGSYPSSAITNFPPGTATAQEAGTTAAGDAVTAFTTIQNNWCYTQEATEQKTGNLGGTLAPGVYNWNAPMDVTSTVTLDAGGDASALFIIRVLGIVHVTASISLAGGASAANVYWCILDGVLDVGGSLSFRGNILTEEEGINLGPGTTVVGSVFSLGVISLFNNPITTTTGFLPTPAGYSCSCPAGYSGTACQTDINECASAPCANAGSCYTSQATNGYVCECAPGFSGLRCQTDINECASAPCANGGSCYTSQATDGYVCTCAPGYSGIRCHTDVSECASAPCTNGGSCYEAAPGAWTCACLPGFSGSRCQTDINECASGPCTNGGSCYTSQATNGYVCTCAPGYSGLRCQTGVNECSSSPCRNGGSCVDASAGYACVCVDGYFGTTCQSTFCDSSPCRSGGTCHLVAGIPGPPVAVPAYILGTYIFNTGATAVTGSVASYPAADIANFPPGTTTGTQEAGTPAAAAAASAFTTIQSWCNAQTATQQKTGTPTGTLTPGVYNWNAQFSVSAPVTLDAGGDSSAIFILRVNGDVEFTSSITLAGGALAANVFWCSTGLLDVGSSVTIRGNLFGMTGVNLGPNSVLTGSAYASAEGITMTSNTITTTTGVAGVAAIFTCTCPPGYSGATCQTDINECASAPCGNGGSCYIQALNGYVCTCAPGYSGLRCQTDINECSSSPCANGGSCYAPSVGGYVCTCAPGYSGSRCQTDVDECSSSPCQNSGSCYTNQALQSWVCECAPGFLGARCETDIDECVSAPCQNGGSCITPSPNWYSCTCHPLWGGPQCASLADECTSSPCMNGATCHSPSGQDLYVCTCAPGFSGTRCQTNVNECASSPCRNGATCVDASGGYACTCLDGYSGPLCQTNINECASNPCNAKDVCIDGVASYTCGCLETPAVTVSLIGANPVACVGGQQKLSLVLEASWGGVPSGHAVGALTSSLGFTGLRCYAWQLTNASHVGCDPNTNTCAQHLFFQSACLTPRADGTTFTRPCDSDVEGDTSHDSGSGSGTTAISFHYPVLDLALNMNVTDYTPTELRSRWITASAIAEIPGALRCGERRDVITHVLAVYVTPSESSYLNIRPRYGFLPSAVSPISALSSSWTAVSSSAFMVGVTLDGVPPGSTYDVQFVPSSIRLGNTTHSYTPSLATFVNDVAVFYPPRGMTSHPPAWPSAHQMVCAQTLNCDVFGLPVANLRTLLRARPGIAPNSRTLMIAADVRYYVYHTPEIESPLSHFQSQGFAIQTPTAVTLHGVYTVTLVFNATMDDSLLILIVPAAASTDSSVVYAVASATTVVMLALVVTMCVCWARGRGSDYNSVGTQDE